MRRVFPFRKTWSGSISLRHETRCSLNKFLIARRGLFVPKQHVDTVVDDIRRKFEFITSNHNYYGVFNVHYDNRECFICNCMLESSSINSLREHLYGSAHITAMINHILDTYTIENDTRQFINQHKAELVDMYRQPKMTTHTNTCNNYDYDYQSFTFCLRDHVTYLLPNMGCNQIAFVESDNDRSETIVGYDIPDQELNDDNVHSSRLSKSNDKHVKHSDEFQSIHVIHDRGKLTT